jgi:hypothetical protein
MHLACGRYDAGFALDDPDALVGAALSCPACLSGDSRVVVGTASARCTCGLCGSTWSLRLAPQQLLRLGLDPPRAGQVDWSASLALRPPCSDRDG